MTFRKILEHLFISSAEREQLRKQEFAIMFKLCRLDRELNRLKSSMGMHCSPEKAFRETSKPTRRH